MSQHITPRVFVSAASSDLGSARKVVNEALTRIECLPIEEPVFGTEYGTVHDLLDRKIAGCQAVIHLVGRDYGGEPDPRTLPDGQPRRSWTQIEYDLAKALQKKLYIFVCADAFPFDPPVESELVEKSDLQSAHRQAVLDDQHLWHTVAGADQLREQVEHLKVSLDEVRKELATVEETVARTGRKLDRSLNAVSDSVARSEQIVHHVAQAQKLAREEVAKHRAEAQKVEQLQKRFAERYLEQLIRNKNLPGEDARNQALAELPALVGLSPDAIRPLIDGRITELAKDAGATPLARARAALTIADYDGVLAEAGEQRSKSRELEMLAGAAALAKFREQPSPHWNDQALAAFHHALALSDDPTRPLERAEAALSVAFVGYHIARHGDAEALLREAWKLREAALGRDDPAVADVLNNLAQLLLVTNRLVEAEPLMRRALAIHERSYGSEHSDVAIGLNNLGQLLQATNRLAETEPLMRRALAIHTQSYAAGHPAVAIDLNNLARLLQATNRLREAEPLCRRGLAIHEQFCGTAHPDTACDLNNLAQLLQGTNRLAQGEPLMRRALARSTSSPTEPSTLPSPVTLAAWRNSSLPRTVWRTPRRCFGALCPSMRSPTERSTPKSPSASTIWGIYSNRPTVWRTPRR